MPPVFGCFGSGPEFFCFFFFCGGGGGEFLQIFPSFSYFFSLYLFSFLLRIYLILLLWHCLFTETSRAFEKKKQGQSRFPELNFSSFCRHLKASGVLLVCWLVGCFGLNGPLRQYFSLYQAVSQREGERKEK